MIQKRLAWFWQIPAASRISPKRIRRADKIRNVIRDIVKRDLGCGGREAKEFDREPK